jgi:MATE family multidrug resistance protein
MSKLSVEISALLKLAVPVALSQLAIMGMGTTDTVLAGHAGTMELAGLSLGNNIWAMIILFFFGIGTITQALVGRFYGAQDFNALRYQLYQSMWLTFACGIVGTVTVLLGAELLLHSNFEPVMAERAHAYLQAIAWGALPMCMIPAFRGSLEAMGLTGAALLINFVAFLINIPLDYALVYGVWGLPKLGAVGCAWASAFLLWLSVFANAALLHWHSHIRHLKIFSRIALPDKEAILKTLMLGLPIGFSILIEMSMFSGAGMLIATYGPIAAGAHSIAISVASASFMIYLGLAQGVTIRASQKLGALKYDEARYSVKVGISFNMLLALFISIVFFAYREPLANLYSSDDAVVSLAIQFMLFGALFQIVDCLQAAAIAALRAYHETASPPRYQIFAYWIVGLPLGIALGFYLDIPLISGPQGFWFAMVVSLLIAGLLMLRKLMLVLNNYSKQQ